MKLTENAIRVLEARYLRRDSERNIIETPEELFQAVAMGVSQAELILGNARKATLWREKFYDLIASFDFLPNSPTLMNAGKPLGQLSACFVLPVEDSIEGIFDTVKHMAMVQRTGGGTGFAFSRLRPRGDLVSSSVGEASGPVSFMKIFDCATENIKQGGKRRGANMGVLRVDHPDIMEFIKAKMEGDILRNFNLSVGVTDRFMDALEAGSEYELIHPVTGFPVQRVQAGEIFEAIAEAAWHTGDPGMIFLDTINRTHPTPNLGEIEATNPCGEIPLLPHESCNLGSINLSRMVRRQGEGYSVDWEKLRETTRVAVRFLDDVVEVSKYPVPEIERMTRTNRKIGLGVMGFAEMLIHLGISYDSKAAVDAADEVMGIVAEEARNASRELAAERGVFPGWKGSRWEAQGMRVRNATQTTVAPSGTISIIAGTSPGIEPLFGLAYRRVNVLRAQTLFEINPVFRRYLDAHGLKPEKIVEMVAEKGGLPEMQDIPEKMRKLFVTAHQVSPDQHLIIQEAFQRHANNSVSKTINLPGEASPEDVAEIYRKAWKLKLKGITVYRYRSKADQVLELGVGEKIKA